MAAAAVLSPPPLGVAVRFGPTLPDMSVPVGTSVVDLKRMVRDREHIHPDDQILLQGGKVLLDDATVGDTEVHVAPQVMDVFLFVAFWKPTLLDESLRVSTSASVAELKRSVCELINATGLLASDSLVLTLGGKTLHNDKRLWWYGVDASCRCEVTLANPLPDGGMLVTLLPDVNQRASDSKRRVFVSSTTTPADLLEQWQPDDSVAAYVAAMKAFNLTLALCRPDSNATLLRDVPLSAQGVVDGSLLALAPGDVDVHVHVDGSDRVVVLRVPGSANVRDASKMVEDATSTSPLELRCRYTNSSGGTSFRASVDWYPVASRGLFNATTGRLELVATPAAPPDPLNRSKQIFVKTLTGAVIALNIDPTGTDTVAYAMEEIEFRLGIPPAQQRLIFGGLQLDHVDRPLSHYKIHAESTLHLVLRLRGGMLHETVCVVPCRLFCMHCRDVSPHRRLPPAAEWAPIGCTPSGSTVRCCSPVDSTWAHCPAKQVHWRAPDVGLGRCRRWCPASRPSV